MPGRMRDAEAPRRRRQLARVEPVDVGRQARDVDGEGDEEDEEGGRRYSVSLVEYMAMPPCTPSSVPTMSRSNVE